MNFTSSRQVLPMVLLIAGVLFAIYLLKSTLEGAVAVDCTLSSATYEQCKNDKKTLTEFCNHNPEVPTYEKRQNGVIAKINPCFDITKDGSDIAINYCHNNPEALYDLCQTYKETLLSYCSGNSQATPSQCVTCDLCTPETRQAFCSTSSHANTNYCNTEDNTIEYCSHNSQALANVCSGKYCNGKPCSLYFCKSNPNATTSRSNIHNGCGYNSDELEAYCKHNPNAKKNDECNTINYCLTYNSRKIPANDIPPPNLYDNSYINLMMKDKQQIPELCKNTLEKSCENLSDVHKYSKCMECTDNNKTALQQAGCNIFDYDAYCNNRNTGTLDPILKCNSKVGTELPVPLP